MPGVEPSHASPTVSRLVFAFFGSVVLGCDLSWCHVPKVKVGHHSFIFVAGTLAIVRSHQ